MKPILDILTGTQSKTKVLKAIAYIDNSASKFKQFITEFMQADERGSQNLAWIIGSIADVHPAIIKPHYSELLQKLQNPCHAAVKRNILRAISKNAIPNNFIGPLANVCFEFLDDSKETIAVRVFSMDILYEICLLEPALSLELVTILRYHIPYSKPGFRSKAKKIINALI